MGKKQITEIVSDTLDNNPEMRVKFARPNEDWLSPQHMYMYTSTLKRGVGHAMRPNW